MKLYGPNMFIIRYSSCIFSKKYVCQFDYGKRKENILLKVFVNQYWMNQVLVLVCGFLNVYGSYFFSLLISVT